VGFEELSHTADVSIRAWGGDLDELFAAAAEGMFALMGAPRETGVGRKVEVAAGDLETLLVDWLSELLYLSEVNGELYDSFAVRVLPSWRLEAAIAGGKGSASGDKVKAVTYHGLCVEHADGRYAATVVFDT